MMIGTGVFGAALIMIGADYFINATRISIYVHDLMMAHNSTVTPCLYGWLIIGFWLAFAIVGTLVQWRVTGAKFDHRQEFSGLGILILLQHYFV